MLEIILSSRCYMPRAEQGNGRGKDTKCACTYCTTKENGQSLSSFPLLLYVHFLPFFPVLMDASVRKAPFSSSFFSMGLWRRPFSPGRVHTYYTKSYFSGFWPSSLSLSFALGGGRRKRPYYGRGCPAFSISPLAASPFHPPWK